MHYISFLCKYNILEQSFGIGYKYPVDIYMFEVNKK